MSVKRKIATGVYTVAQFVIGIFAIVGTCITHYAPKNTNACYTFWGYKEDCSKHEYTTVGIEAFGCTQRMYTMRAAAAFSFGASLVALVTVIYGITLFFGCTERYLVAFLLATMCSIGLLVSWACLAGVYNLSMCVCTDCKYQGPFKDLHLNYGPGFYLILVAWVMEMCNVAFIFVVMLLQ